MRPRYGKLCHDRVPGSPKKRANGSRNETALRKALPRPRCRCYLTGGPSAADGWPSRTWSSGPSAPAGVARFLKPVTGAGLDAWQAERYQRGETGQRLGYTDNPFRPY